MAADARCARGCLELKVILMIGVIADSAEQEVVREFFELFKTPWEFYQQDRQYEVLICAGDNQYEIKATVVLIYAGRKLHFDDLHNIETGCQLGRACIVAYQENRIPIYGDTITFPEKGNRFLTEEVSQQCVAYVDRSKERVLARIGYDLFREIRTLLEAGQPPANASMPTLELHISLLRDVITGCGIPVVEIPPVPEGYRFITCLTHDVDHPSIRQHKWDHAMFGFLYRAVFGSLRDLIYGRLSVGGLVTNWVAALKLPFVHLGFAKDFWGDFGDRYLHLEKGVCSTFFVIPFKDRPGKNSQSRAVRLRGARYDARDIAETLQKLLPAGSEVGLHGIDAWVDSAIGREELEEIRRLTGASEIGVRMHWLYYDQQSPVALEQAGANYDSTIGYNETVGYRAGTTQAYKPIAASRLLELPLHAMDTALFYPSYLGLSPRQARTLLGRMVEDAVRFGGCFTVNWHDRSTAPERLWGTSYRDLVQDLKGQDAWFATAGQAVAWFRKRRSVVFETDCSAPYGVRARVVADRTSDLPGLRLRIHKARTSNGERTYGSEGYVDMAFNETVDALIPCGVSK